ncbi:hypothetical protein MKW98_017089 [Papaver atlanticum]|uniref:HTH TFE/IIEalpha-type domain-containing protein n=1 Tax=Papaver atlanticum TaxID=357466 RepID=A0AAD4XXX3_9MAGN|nr:hypothetical protein MKW98_017089 [Papaver atlanticum]
MEIDFAKISAKPYNTLVEIVLQAFYDDDIRLKTEKQSKNRRSDNRGMAIVVLLALTRRQWVREDDLAKDLKLSPIHLRQTLCFFEEEKLIIRVTRKETAKGAHRFNAAVANTTDGKEGEEKKKVHTHSYCCLDYSQIYDVVIYRLHRMKKKLEDELECCKTVEEYVCPRCKRKYNSLDALQLISQTGEGFHCENCNLGMVDGGHNARRRREKLRGMLEKMEVQLEPLQKQLKTVKSLPCPEFGTLQEWEAGASLPFMGDTKVDVELSGVAVKEEDIKLEAGAEKMYPPWMIRQGMNLTKDGEVLPSDRQVGMKCKREDVEWEDAPTRGMATVPYKLYDLKVSVEEPEEDEIDWEDG